MLPAGHTELEVRHGSSYSRVKWWSGDSNPAVACCSPGRQECKKGNAKESSHVFRVVCLSYIYGNGGGTEAVTFWQGGG